jgi:hypothetical protein
MIEDDLSRVEESATKSIYKLGIGFERYEDKGEKSAPNFVPSSNYHKEKKTLKSTKTHYPSNPKPSFNLKREVRKEISKLREETFICMFVAVLVTWMSSASVIREWRRDTLIMLETRIVMSLLIFRLILLLMLCFISFMDLTITHMVLVHERIALYLDALVTTHVLIMVIVPHVGMVFLLEGLTLALSQDIWTFHVSPVVVHVPLAQMVRCKRL